MTKRKSTKRALLLSALSLLLCVSMLIGSTFAWFTDSVTSKNNIIKAGNLDVELEYKKVVDGVATDWASVKDQDNIFDKNALWEPGHVEVVYLKVTNLGSLALKYQLSVNVYNEIIGKTEDGKDIKLSDHLVFKTVDMADGLTTYTDREAVKLAAGTEKGLKDYNGKTTSLEAKNEAGTNNFEDYVALIVYMPETVGNEANYRGKDIPTIELGINLYATQFTAEEDSFDEFYDEDAWHPDMVVTTADELGKAIKEVKDGGIIALGKNLTFDKDTVTYNGTWADGLCYDGDKSFTLDLNGKSITGDSAVNDYLLLFKNNGQKANTINIKNGTIEAPSSAYAALATASSNAQTITINLENVNLINNHPYGATLKIRGGTQLNVKAGTVITGKDSYVGIEAAGAKTVVNVYDGTEFYQNGTSSYLGSLIGVSFDATVNVYGGYGKSAQGGFFAMTSGGTINVYGGEWIANTDGTPVDSNRAVLLAQNDKNVYPDSGKSVVNVYGGILRGGYNTYATVAGESEINIQGGNFNADPASYVVSSYKAVANGDGTYSVVFPQESANELFANTANGGTVTLPAGTFTIPSNVAGKTITVEGSGDSTVIDFTKVNSVGGAAITFKNLKIQGVNANSNYGFGIQNTTADIVYENCTLDGAVTHEYYGTVTYRNCTFTGMYYITTYSLKSATFENCVFDKADSRALLVFSHGNNPVNVTVKNCTFKAADKGYTGSGAWTAAVEIDTTNIPSTGTIVKIDDCLYDSNYNGFYRDKSTANKNAQIFVDGDDVVNTIKIGTREELKAFADDVNVNGNSYSGKTVVLTADIDLENMAWTPIGQTGGYSAKTYFQGTFDGKGHTISNLNVTVHELGSDEGMNYASGLFGFIDGADANIRNLTIQNANVVGSHWTGVIAGYLTGKIDNCKVYNATVVCNHINGEACGDKAGVIVGMVQQADSYVRNCYVEASSVSAGRDAGVIIGCCNNATAVENSSGNTYSNVTVTANGTCTHSGAGTNIKVDVIGRIA